MNYIKIKRGASAILWYVVLIVVAFIFALPFFWMFFAAFKTPQQNAQFPPVLWPNPWSLGGIKEGLETGLISKYMLNSLVVSFSCVIGTILSSSLVAFGFARLRARGKDILFLALLGTMMIPSTITLIPNFVMFSKLGFVNTFLPLILPSFLGGGAFNIFLLRQFFSTLPVEMQEAAMIDGCSWIRIFYQLYIPNAKPALLTVSIFTFVNTWNDFFNPMIYLLDPKKYTIAVGLQFLQGQQTTVFDITPMMAMSLLSVLPVILLFAVAQKYFIQGISTTGIK